MGSGGCGQRLRRGENGVNRKRNESLGLLGSNRNATEIVSYWKKGVCESFGDFIKTVIMLFFMIFGALSKKHVVVFLTKKRVLSPHPLWTKMDTHQGQTALNI